MVVWSGIRRENVENERVCLSEEKRKKVKGRKGMAGQKREKRWCENEWWVGGGHM